MKIYPSKHKIKSIPASKIDTDLNIPLAYVNVDYTKYSIDKIVDPKFSKSVKGIIYPEQEFETKDFLMFNEFEEVVNKNNLLMSSNNAYKFYPANAVKFSPKHFLWNATIKKNLEYNISTTYNINIGCKYDETLNRNLTTAFMNPSDRDMFVYSNIKINSNDDMYNTFDTMTDENADFMFIKTHNCKHYDVEGLEEIDMYSYLQKHTNIWFGCEDAKSINETFNMMVSTTPTLFTIKEPIISKHSDIQSSYYFDLNSIATPAGITVHNIFDTFLVPVLILEYENLGFVIISSYSILDDPVQYENFMYEVMMYVYCHTYEATGDVEDWITYKLPDYEVSNGIYAVKSNFTAKKSISSILDIPGSYSLSKIDIKDSDAIRLLDTGEDLQNTTGAIQCIGLNSGKPIFTTDGLMAGYTEPDKPLGWKSIYCNGYIYYIDKLYYLIEQDITNKIMLIEKDTDLIVKLYGFKSSSLNINKQADTNLKISFIKTDGELTQRVRDAEYTVYYIGESGKVSYCFAEDYEEVEGNYKLFNILVQQTDDAVDIYDMRQLGGGLAEDAADNFELLDIGHINGRPYRIAGALVLTMPTKYKPYEAQIQKVLDKYKTAEDYIAIIFKDEEDDDN